MVTEVVKEKITKIKIKATLYKREGKNKLIVSLKGRKCMQRVNVFGQLSLLLSRMFSWFYSFALLYFPI